jgi:Protein of unknown function (DUF1501)
LSIRGRHSQHLRSNDTTNQAQGVEKKRHESPNPTVRTSAVHFFDVHATILNLPGLDHPRLTFRHSGRDFRVTDMKARVVTDVII